jgi:hypothetical protein
MGATSRELRRTLGVIVLSRHGGLRPLDGREGPRIRLMKNKTPEDPGSYQVSYPIPATKQPATGEYPKATQQDCMPLAARACAVVRGKIGLAGTLALAPSRLRVLSAAPRQWPGTVTVARARTVGVMRSGAFPTPRLKAVRWAHRAAWPRLACG